MINFLIIGGLYFLGFGTLIVYMIHKELKSVKYSKDSDSLAFMRSEDD